MKKLLLIAAILAAFTTTIAQAEITSKTIDLCGAVGSFSKTAMAARQSGAEQGVALDAVKGSKLSTFIVNQAYTFDVEKSVALRQNVVKNFTSAVLMECLKTEGFTK